MTLILTADQQSTLTATFKDVTGVDLAPDLSNPHAPQPIWTEDSKQTVIMLLPSADKLSCEVIAIAPGTANVTVTDGGTNKQATEQVIVKENGIHSIAISSATPVRQASAPLVGAGQDAPPEPLVAPIAPPAPPIPPEAPVVPV